MTARHSYARCLLERGIRVSSAVTMLQAKFGIARSSAYEDLKIAQAEINASDDAPASDEPIVCPETLQGQLVHSLDKAFATDSFKEIPKLIKALDEVKRWQGYALQAEGMANHIGC